MFKINYINLLVPQKYSSYNRFANEQKKPTHQYMNINLRQQSSEGYPLHNPYIQHIETNMSWSIIIVYRLPSIVNKRKSTVLCYISFNVPDRPAMCLCSVSLSHIYIYSLLLQHDHCVCAAHFTYQYIYIYIRRLDL